MDWRFDIHILPYGTQLINWGELILSYLITQPLVTCLIWYAFCRFLIV